MTNDDVKRNVHVDPQIARPEPACTRAELGDPSPELESQFSPRTHGT